MTTEIATPPTRGRARRRDPSPPRRRIVILSALYPPSSMAAAVRARAFATGLARRGHRVTVVTAAIGHVTSAADDRVHVVRVPWLDLERVAYRLRMNRTVLGKPRFTNGAHRESPLRDAASRLLIPDLFVTWLPGAL